MQYVASFDGRTPFSRSLPWLLAKCLSYVLSVWQNKISSSSYFSTSVGTEQWALPVTAAVHGINSRRCYWRRRDEFQLRKSVLEIPIMYCSWKNEYL